jgi:hypothetical protein
MSREGSPMDRDRDSDAESSAASDSTSLVDRILACKDLMLLIADAAKGGTVLSVLTKAIRTVWRTQVQNPHHGGKRKRGEEEEQDDAEDVDEDEDEDEEEGNHAGPARDEPDAAVVEDAPAAAAAAAPAPKPPRRKKREPETTLPLAFVLLPLDGDAVAPCLCYVCNERVKDKSDGLTLDGRAVGACQKLHCTPLRYGTLHCVALRSACDAASMARVLMPSLLLRLIGHTS